MSIVLITGGRRGLGTSIGVEYARRGMGVVLTFNTRRDAAEAVIERIASKGGAAVALPLDVADSAGFPAFRAALVATLSAHWGRDGFDVLVNNAGVGLYNSIETVTKAQFESLYMVRLRGPFFLTQLLLPLLAEGGQIVNMASATARVGEAADVGTMVASLLGPENAWISGQTIEVSGGCAI
ncbi:SDR family NAD(P)-dependent oxidoreductase [Palleronia sp. LCG004]|uniref:SDR family NAD(P)-dependent oxidoreductase n=1 Tax=Palleronia sp. LCG004 TaxID=3079304 RepID=UPI002943492C|nr:SDR family NAD(P)-dependent oxidoreductase [Palleronia sp. LCG004]WOI57887.1 SDR family oxidoreductase [Palleronia sp. LCG004]